LPEADDLLESIVEFLPDATFVIDSERRIVAWNRACEVWTGVKKELLLGKGDYAYSEPFYGIRRPMLIDLLDFPSLEVEATYDHIKRNGDVLSAESLTKRRSDGLEIHFRADAAPLFNRKGQRCGAMEVIRNITEQKQVAQALQDSQERLLTAQRVARVGFLDWDLKTNQIFLSDETCELTGYRPEGQVATPDFVAQSVHPDDVAYAGENLNLAIQGIKPYDIVHRHLRPDGKVVWVHAQAELTRDENGAPSRLLGTMVDITEQKRSEEALKASEREYRELVMLANSIILRWTRDGRITFLNEFGQRFFGYTNSELVGRHVIGTIVPETDTTGRDLRPLMDEVCAYPKRFERSSNENMRRNGERVWIDWTNKVVLDEHGQIREILSIGSDITERKLAEEQVQKLHDELQHRADDLEQRVLDRTAQLATRNQELKDFAYTVSHDLKAPLRGIAGYANELARKHQEGLGERAQFCLTQILTATSNLDHLIEDLLRYSRLDAESPSPTTVDLRNLVNMILRDRELEIQNGHIEVTLDIPFATLQTWERGLVQVMSNLIDNAIKYSRDATPPRLHIEAKSLDQVWQIIVGDNGIGFDMKYHERLFKLFNRLVRMDEFEGTGAGLAIARKVIEKQGGRIWAESAPQQGARFFVELPKPSE
jgi:PAS domain S-box-containing protein